MSRVVVSTGDEAPGIREALDYLQRQYLIPDLDIRSITVDAKVGDVPRITVTVFVNDEGPTAADVHPALARRLRSLGWTPPAMGQAVTTPTVTSRSADGGVIDPLKFAVANGGCGECGAWRIDGKPPTVHKDDCSQGRR